MTKSSSWKRKKPCAEQAQCEVYWPQSTNLVISQEIRWHRIVCDDWLIGWLQRPARDSPDRGHLACSICRGLPSPNGSRRREARKWHQTAFGGYNPAFSQRLPPEVFFISGCFRKTDGCEIRVLISNESRQWQLSLTMSHYVVFAYDQVIRPHRWYNLSGELPSGKLHARGVDNGGRRQSFSALENPVHQS